MASILDALSRDLDVGRLAPPKTGDIVDAITRAITANGEAELSASEAAWLSGYFAALARERSRAVRAPELAPIEPKLATSQANGSSVRVLFASETGNAAALAEAVALRLRTVASAVEVTNLASYKPRSLEREHAVVIVTSTHGDGTPPEPALRFFEMLEQASAPKSLPNLRYAVLGLGDSSYEHFCRAARTVDERLSKLGAKRLLPRLDCDLDFEQPAGVWTEELLGHLRVDDGSVGATVTDLRVASVAKLSPPAAATAYGKQRPFAATVLESTPLTGRGSSKDTRHVALSIEGSDLAFTPGDALGVCASNEPASALQLARALGASGDELLTLDGERISLAVALIERLDLMLATPAFLRAWAQASRSAELARLAQDVDGAERRKFLRSHHVIDIVLAYPVTKAELDLEALIPTLRRLTPRLYSIASSLAATPDEVHLTVGVVRYVQNGRACSGVASGHIADRAKEGEALPVYVHSNPAFRLPPNHDARLLMIGAGTGVAPYRAFLQERAAVGARGKSWMFFGERNFRSDFLYQTEWQAWVRDQTLSQLSLAFSRDQASKLYVQHRMREHSRAIYDWLQEGAHVYVCGDAAALAPDVHEALLWIIEKHQSTTRERAVEYLHELREQQRYQRDVY